MEMREKDLDRILANQDVSPQMKMAALHHYSDESSQRGSGFGCAIIGLIAAGVAAMIIYCSNENPADNSRTPSAQTSSTAQVEYRR